MVKLNKRKANGVNGSSQLKLGGVTPGRGEVVAGNGGWVTIDSGKDMVY